MVEKIKSSYMPLMFGDYEQSYIFEYTRQFQNITWLIINIIVSQNVTQTRSAETLFDTFPGF